MKLHAEDQASGMDRASYYAAASAWAEQTIGGRLASGGAVARLAAVAAVVIAIANGFALLQLFPLRQAKGYVVAVDRQGGYAQAVSRLKPGALSNDIALTQAYLADYVTAREGFDPPHLVEAYRTVALMSDPEVARTYAAGLSKTGPTSPLNLYPPSAQVVVTISTVSLLGAGQALVRYDTQRADLPMSPPQPAMAFIAYRYVSAPMRNADRFVDPLGFQVTAYRTQPG